MYFWPVIGVFTPLPLWLGGVLLTPLHPSICPSVHQSVNDLVWVSTQQLLTIASSNLTCMLMETPRFATSGLLADFTFDFRAMTLTSENWSSPVLSNY